MKLAKQPEPHEFSGETPHVARIHRRLSSGWRRHTMPGLPDDLLRDSARRLRVIALIYAAGYTLGEGTAVLLDPIAREPYAHFIGWAIPFGSIGVALLMAALASTPRIPPRTLMNLGLVFEVIAAYGIAAGTYWEVYQGLAHTPAHLTVFGLSYVAPWIMFFTIVAPNEPRKALAAAIAAGSSVPVVVLLSIRYGGTTIVPGASFVANGLILPWVMVVVTAYIGAIVVYRMGSAVTMAREMGSYRLTERLGAGGMGEVWKAKHRMLARPAAIKLIRPDMLGDQDRESYQVLLERFKREAQATALMRSPHTIGVYDFGATADGTFYYVMELLNGFDLDTLVNRFGPLPAGRVVYLLRQVCDSLVEAHEHDLIHRDLKPANIYLCRQGLEVDFVKVLDFGLVKPRKEKRTRDPQLTADHITTGTPAYMPPEQINSAAVDARTDLYALGCVAYWLLTGQLVFDAPTPLAMMARHMQTKPAPPSTRSELPIPGALDDVVLACLEKEPAKRPASARALHAMLTRCEVDVSWTPEKAREWWERHEPG